MVGHTGDFGATVKAMEATDRAVGAFVDAVRAAGGAILVTADHGNAEEMAFRDGTPNTQHSTNVVPVILATADDVKGVSLHDGALADVAPTLLTLMGLPVPGRMTGRSLIEST